MERQSATEHGKSKIGEFMRTGGHAQEKFVPTRWSVVLQAGQTASPQVQDALSTLCQTYWYPLYAYVRRQGYTPHDAQDLTQEFFARLLEKKYLARIKREGGRFRSFLLTALKRFLAKEWKRAKAQKRGGKHTIISFDQKSAELRYDLELAHGLTPEKIYEQQWAQALLGLVLARLHQEYEALGKTKLFEQISQSLSNPRGAVPYATIACNLNTTGAAVKMAVQRLRGRYRELLRMEIAHTVSSPDEVEAEIRHLYSTFNP
jgi:RNA polymerase sigma-70 factor (ECF subfamily)